MNMYEYVKSQVLEVYNCNPAYNYGYNYSCTDKVWIA